MQTLSVNQLTERLVGSDLSVEINENGLLDFKLMGPSTWFFIDLPEIVKDRMRTIGELFPLFTSKSSIVIARKSLHWDTRGTPTTGFGLVSQGLCSSLMRYPDKVSHGQILLFSPEERSLAAALAFSFSTFATSPPDDLLILSLEETSYFLTVNHHDEIVCAHLKGSKPRHSQLGVLPTK